MRSVFKISWLQYNKAVVKFLMGKSRVVLTCQSGWVISRNELEAAGMSSELMLQAEKALDRFNCNKFFWTDSRVLLGRITNPDLNLTRFVKRRVDKILRVASSDVWNYVSTEENPTDVGTRDDAFKKSDSVQLWLEGPKFLSEAAPSEVVTVCMNRLGNESRESSDFGLDQIIESSSDLYVSKKRAAYLNAFVEYVVATVKGRKFYKPVLSAAYLDLAFLKVVK